MNNENYLVPFELISIAGNSRTLAIQASKEASEMRFDKAENLLKEAEEQLIEAHKLQTSLFTKEMNGDKNEINIILIHAMDHLSLAIEAIDNTNQFIKLYKIISKFQNSKEREEEKEC